MNSFKVPESEVLMPKNSRTKHNLTMKQMNASKQGLPQMTNDVIEGFRAQNDLDYKIYDYCRMKLLERDK